MPTRRLAFHLQASFDTVSLRGGHSTWRTPVLVTWEELAGAPKLLGTIHPSAVLRLRSSDERAEALRLLATDLATAAEAASALAPEPPGA